MKILILMSQHFGSCPDIFPMKLLVNYSEQDGSHMEKKKAHHSRFDGNYKCAPSSCHQGKITEQKSLLPLQRCQRFPVPLNCPLNPGIESNVFNGDLYLKRLPLLAFTTRGCFSVALDSYSPQDTRHLSVCNVVFFSFSHHSPNG